MTDEIKPKSHRELVELDPLIISKINGWFEQIDTKKKIKISRRSLVNWLLTRMPDTLSNSEMSALIETFYDERRFLRQLLRESERAKATGSGDTLDIIVKSRKIDMKNAT